ncbi:acetyl-CoA carboxylase biotin carboxyl carrier protein subunit [Parabacteroides sp. Marseille-P3160]|uniref:acetyl-CoA carboxylase biotin carboxyl carrier protein subunit n=1 Tax=Parabacteroides sp. Marseille-P3160 TaxID=1917887 RepID=UPI0009BAB0D8|nr:acetyl-CoA carboxylase biotin carboxyl carrier protein subunit [Parabacteroides sp. Marseille-P3160]
MEIHIGSRVAEVEMINKDGNKIQVTIDGKPYDVDVVMAENGVCSILHEGRSYNAELFRFENGKNYKVNMPLSSYAVNIIDSQAKYLRLRKKQEDLQDDKIISPMPGKVVRIPIKVGDFVPAGETVVVLEAMKMQSNYKVNADCYIKEILVKEGDAVNNDQVLIRLDLNVEKEENDGK